MATDTDELQAARTELEDATKTAGDDVRDDLRETASEFAGVVSGDQQADHAVMDEHLNALRQAREQADGETADRIDRALEHAENYREGLEQG